MKNCIVSAVFALITVTSFSQIQIDDRAGYGLKDRGYLGLGLGNIGFGSGTFGSYYVVGLSPQAGYMINQYFSAGAAFDYQYTGYPQAQVHTTLYGGYPYVRFNIKRFFAQMDYDWYSAQVSGLSERKIYNRAFIGGGYFTQGRGRGGVNFLVSYDLLWSANSPWNSPLSFRIFFTF